MISKFLSKLKSILFKSAVTPETPLKKEKIYIQKLKVFINSKVKIILKNR